MPNTCDECGGYTNGSELPSGYQRHHDECTCIKCEDCGMVMGNTIESDEWNQRQKQLHYTTLAGYVDNNVRS